MEGRCDTSKRLVFVLALAWAAGSAATEPSPCDVQTDAGDSEIGAILLNGRLLGEAELRMYVQIENEARKVAPRATTDDEFVAIMEILRRIDDLPAVVQEDSRDRLRNAVSDRIREAVACPDPLVQKLLSTGDPVVQLVGIRAIDPQSEHELMTRTGLVHRLLEMLADDGAVGIVRESILGAFFVDSSFDVVRAIAERLATGPDQDLARTAAVYMYAPSPFDLKFDLSDAEEHFRNGDGVLRQEAAIALTRYAGQNLSEDLRREVAAELTDMMRNTRLEGRTRGEAIEESDVLLDVPGVLETLMDLADRNQWFTGVWAVHGSTHSLVPIVRVLRDSDDPRAKRRLERLRGEVDTLEEGTREDVLFWMK